jgi:hypothetical protein
LPDEFAEYCGRFLQDRIVKIDVIAATVTNADDRLILTTRIFLNAAEIGVGAEIISRSKKVRNELKDRLVSTLTGVVTALPTYESNLCEISLDGGREKLLAKMTMYIIAN